MAKVSIRRSVRVHYDNRRDDLRPKRAEINAAIRSGFLGRWRKWERYKIDRDRRVICGLGEVKDYFPSPSAGLVRQLEALRDEESLLRFTKTFGLLGCGLPPDEEGNRTISLSGDDSIDLCFVHAETIYVMRTLLAQLSLALRTNGGERARLATVISHIERFDLSLGEGKVGPILVRFSQVDRERPDPVSTARWILQQIVTDNTQGIRPFLYFGSAMRTRTWLRFGGLYELAYWHLAHEAADDRLRKCKRSDCPRIFEAKNRKQIYCSRRCLDIDKQARYELKRKGHKR